MKTNRLAMALTIINFLLLIVLLVQSRAIANQTIPQVLRARAFELVDENGQVRAQLNVESNGEVVFRLRDQNGMIHVKLGASEEGPGLLLANQDGTSPTLIEASGAKQVIEP